MSAGRWRGASNSVAGPSGDPYEWTALGTWTHPQPGGGPDAGGEREPRSPRQGAGARGAVRRLAARTGGQPPDRARRRGRRASARPRSSPTWPVVPRSSGSAFSSGHCLDIDAGVAFGAVIEAVRELVARLDDLESHPRARRMSALLDPETPRSPEPFRVLEDLRQTVLEAAAAGPRDVRAGGHALGGPLDPGLRRGASRHGARAAAVRAHRPDRRPAPATPGPEDPRRDQPASPAPGAWTWPPRPGQHRRHRGARTRRHGRRGAGAVGAGAFGGQPAVRRGARGRGPARDPRASCPTSSSPGSTRWPTARASCCASPPSTARGSTPTRSPSWRASTDAQLDAFLRELLDANLLRGAGDSLAFRHGLLREAVYDDLLPDERTRLHARARPPSCRRGPTRTRTPACRSLSRLAFHWSAAHDLPRTLEASVRAGEVAWRIGAAEADHPPRASAVACGTGCPTRRPVAGCTQIELRPRLARAALRPG